MISALVSALQAMGYNKGNGRNNNRGTGNSSTGRPDPYPSEPCLNCGLINHTREKCIKKKVTCRFCGKEGHLPAYCPHNPTSGGKRKALTPALRATVDREAGPTSLPNVTPGAPGTSASHAPSTYACGREGPVATHGRLPRPSPRSASLAHIYIPVSLLLLFGGSISIGPIQNEAAGFAPVATFIRNMHIKR